MWSGENLIYQETKTCIMKYRADIELINGTFELIEEDTIDIEGIEKLVTGYSESGADTDIINYINDKIVPCIKQLNKEIKSIKEKN